MIAPENIFLPLEIWYQDSLGNFNQPKKVFFNGVEYDGTAGALQGITLKDLLESAGVALDDYNDFLSSLVMTKQTAGARKVRRQD